jgi:hypothetical protein
MPADTTPHPGTAAGNSCDPLFVDAVGDVKDAGLDLVRSRITKVGDTLVFTHKIRDLTDVYSTRERRLWQLWFDLGGKTYFVRATHYETPTGGEERFEVVRSSSTEESNTGASMTQTAMVASATGTIDNDADSIDVVVSISQFNEGERKLSAAEGDESPPQLEDGSTLHKIGANTSTSKLGAPGDAAEADCDYRLS